MVAGSAARQQRSLQTPRIRLPEVSTGLIRLRSSIIRHGTDNEPMGCVKEPAACARYTVRMVQRPNRKGTIGTIGATAIGVGGMMGAGLYTLLGLAVESTGVWLPFAFLVGGIVASFSVYSYSKLGIAFPNRGGAAQYLLTCFGDGMIAGAMNVFQYLGWIVAMALYATGFSEYLRDLLGLPAWSWLGPAIGIGIVAVMVGINIVGNRMVAHAQTAIISFELIVLAAFLVIGLAHARMPVITTATQGSIWGVFSAAGLLYVTYEGFGVMANAAGSMKDPARQLPRAMFSALAIVMAVYIIASIVVVATLGVAGAESAQGHALAEAGSAVAGGIGFAGIGAAALVATASAVDSTMFGDANLGLRVAKAGEVPRQFGFMTQIGGTRGLFVTAVLTCLFIIVFPLSSVGEMASLAFLLVYATVSAGHLRVRQRTGARKAPLVLAIVFNLVLFCVLMTQSIAQGDILTWASLVGLFVFSIVAEWAWRKAKGLNLSPIAPSAPPPKTHQDQHPSS